MVSTESENAYLIAAFSVNHTHDAGYCGCEEFFVLECSPNFVVFGPKLPRSRNWGLDYEINIKT